MSFGDTVSNPLLPSKCHVLFEWPLTLKLNRLNWKKDNQRLVGSNPGYQNSEDGFPEPIKLGEFDNLGFQKNFQILIKENKEYFWNQV